VAARRVPAGADIAGLKTKERRQDLGFGPGAKVVRQDRQPEPRPAARAVIQGLDHAGHDPDLLLQAEGAGIAPGGLLQGQQHRCAHRRVAREGQLPAGGEDAQARPVAGLGGRQHEHRLGQVELPRDGLHGGRVEAVRIEHHGERVAGEPVLGEHVEGDEAARHRIGPSCFRCGSRTQRRSVAQGFVRIMAPWEKMLSSWDAA
jgi:hypothetical protein